MNVTYPVAVVGDLIGDPARAAMLLMLLDGRARTAGELALHANVSAQSVSGHLSKLMDGGLLTVRSVGRNRYYNLASAEVAHALEALGAIATKPRTGHARAVSGDHGLYLARTCYDHLAGKLAVELTGKLLSSGVIQAGGQRDFDLGPNAERCFGDLEIDVEKLRRSRRCFARQCLDWTERRPHVAGALGAALCARFFALGWIKHRNHTRAVRITEVGAREFRKRFGADSSY